MTLIIENLKDALKYPFSDWKAFFLIGTIMLLISFLKKYTVTDQYLASLAFIVSSLLMFIEIGYGSKISAASIRGNDNPPKVNKIAKLIWEGFKKTCIISIYAVVMHYLISLANAYMLMGSPLCIIFYILFIFVYILLIFGLINRYTHNGSFTKAFDYKEIFGLFKKIRIKKMVLIIISAVIAHIFAIQSLMDICAGFKLIELYYIIATFILAPFMLITTKRFIALNVRETLDEKNN